VSREDHLMSTSTTLFRIASADVAGSLAEARDAAEQLEGTEILLDFSAVRRLDVADVTALAELSAVASKREVRLTARAVSVGVYKVLQLAGLSGAMSFMSD